MTSPTAVSKWTYAGLFLITLTTLMYEILLTRIFSVTMWYHFAFMAISVAMFGMTVGAIVVYALPGRLLQDRVPYFIGASALLFAVSIFLCFLLQLKIPYVASTSLGVVSLTYLVTAVPFFFSGICVCLALTRLPQEDLGKLYAADLVGAAFGCVLFVYIIGLLGGPTAVIGLAFLAAAGSVLFLHGTRGQWLIRGAVAMMIFFAAFTVIHTYLVSKHIPLLRLTWVKGKEEIDPVYEKWNSFSRIQVIGDNDPKPFGWGLSPGYEPRKPVQEMFLQIDAAAVTVMTKFKSLQDLEYLKFDVVNIVHYIRPHASVFAVGAGGGRDALSALVFDQKSVAAVEINPDIIDTVNTRFGDFTGHLDRNPKVRFIHDEARSYLARESGKFDIIQVSLIDTWAATAAGAFVLTENSLYTVEAWKIFIEHLNQGGVLTFSRWYFQERPGEMYRLTSLATATLMKLGVSNPRNHIMIVRHLWKTDAAAEPSGIGTILVSNTPFSDEDISQLDKVARHLRFEVAFTPKGSLDPVFEKITSGGDFDHFTSHFPIDITPPTDDRPFFFNMLRFSNIFEGDLLEQGANYSNMVAVYVLGTLLILIVGLAVVFIVLPLIITARVTGQKRVFPFFLFFASIGAGFMLIEISLMQRLIVFLGHPAYSLSVVLFSLLLSAGLGSYSTQSVLPNRFFPSAIVRLSILLFLLALEGLLTPYCLHVFQGASTFSRILMAVFLLLPLGFFMGMAFPIGMRVGFSRLPALTPWFWGINGGISVCASVISFAIALSSGISVAYWTGFASYLAAFIGFLWAGLPGDAAITALAGFPAAECAGAQGTGHRLPE